MPGLGNPSGFSCWGCCLTDSMPVLPSSAGVASAIKTVHIKLIGISTDITCKSLLLHTSFFFFSRCPIGN